MRLIEFFINLSWFSHFLWLQQVVDFCEELYVSGVRSPFLLAFLVDLYSEKRLEWNEAIDEDDDPKQLEEKVNEICTQLISTHDTIRAKYWEYILNKFKIKLSRNETDQEINPNSNQDEWWTSHTL